MFISLRLTLSLHLRRKSHHLVVSFHIQQGLTLFILVSEWKDLTPLTSFHKWFFVLFYDFYD